MMRHEDRIRLLNFGAGLSVSGGAVVFAPALLDGLLTLSSILSQEQVGSITTVETVRETLAPFQFFCSTALAIGLGFILLVAMDVTIPALIQWVKDNRKKDKVSPPAVKIKHETPKLFEDVFVDQLLILNIAYKNAQFKSVLIRHKISRILELLNEIKDLYVKKMLSDDDRHVVQSVMERDLPDTVKLIPIEEKRGQMVNESLAQLAILEESLLEIAKANAAHKVYATKVQTKFLENKFARYRNHKVSTLSLDK